MALQVWLPLNGDLHNQGLSDVTATNNGATVSDAGKIGKCYEFGDGSASSKGININNNFLNIGASRSICAWVYPKGNHYHYSGTIVSSGNWNGKRWAFCLKQDNTGFTGFDNIYSSYYSTPIPVNTWTHLCVTVEGNITKFYKNGIYLGQLSRGETFQSDATNTYIGRETYANGYFTFNGCINDVRIYDHALSKREVKDIAKGLVLHYKLDDPYIESYTNIYPAHGQITTTFYNAANSKSGYGDATYFTRQIYTENGTTISKVYCNTPNVNVYPYVFFGSTVLSPELTIGSTKTLSFDIYPHSPSSQRSTVYFYSYRSDKCNILLTNTTTGISVSRSDTTQGPAIPVIQDTWNHIVLTLTESVDASPSKGWGYMPLNSGIWESDGTEYFLFKNIQVTADNHEHPWIPGNTSSVPSTSVYDCSGYNNDGTINSQLEVSVDSPRYSKSTRFNGVDNNIVSSFPSYNTDVSFVIWTKFNKTSNTHLLDCRNSSGVGYQPMFIHSTYIQIGGSANSFVNINYSFSTNIWYHIAVVHNNEKGVVYVNGVKVGESTSAKGAIYSQTLPIHIGSRYSNSNWFNGNISDFRIYSTALSEKDIQELYNLGAWVDKNGNLNCYEGIELESNPEVNKRGQFKSKKFDEVEFYDYLENVSTSYIDTEYDIGPDNGKNIKLYIDYIATNTQVGNRWWVHGLGGASNLTIHAGIGDGSSGTNVKFVYGNGTNDVRTNVYGDIGTRYIYELDLKNKTYIVKDINGNTLVNLSNFTVNTPTKTYSPYIYAWKRGSNGVLGYSHSGKMYRYRLYDNDVLVRNFIPCKYAGEAGMWDIVEGKFYGNKGSGTFVLGDRIDVDVSIYANKIESNQLLEI